MQRIELNAASYADAVITHSSFEAELLRQWTPRDKIHLVPWAVPVKPTAIPLAQRRGVAFIAHYGHQPNVDAAHWLIDAIMPELAKLDPTIPCLLVGSHMPASLSASARAPVEAVGGVDDLATIFDRVRLTIAPLAFGAGIKGKVLDSLAAGIPCLCTPVAAEGLDLPPLLTAQVATTPSQIAAGIARLHNDEALNPLCSEAGLSYIAENMSDAAIDAALQAAVRQ
jgi:hypothetical protein